MKCPLVLISMAAFFTTLPAPALGIVLFSDPFNLNPDSNGWVESFNPASGPTGDFVATGTSVRVDMISGNETFFLSITRTVDTTGFNRVTVELAANQSSAPYESTDYLAIEFDPTGSDSFTAILEDREVWNGVNDLVGEGTPGTDGNTTITSTGSILLPSSANNNPDLQLRITARISSGNEDMFLDQFTVSAVPEPSRTMLILFGGASMIATRRRLAR
ncbi:MAG: PEP-CTERM sorting domain-containing protein [Verrucomicrobiota bacterium]